MRRYICSENRAEVNCCGHKPDPQPLEPTEQSVTVTEEREASINPRVTCPLMIIMINKLIQLLYFP